MAKEQELVKKMEQEYNQKIENLHHIHIMKE